MNLETRVLRLERSVKLWRLIGVVGLLLAVGMGAAIENSVSEVVRTKRFELIGPDGKPCGMFIHSAESKSFLVAGKIATQEVMTVKPVE